MFFHRIKTEHFVYRNATLSVHEKQCKMNYLIQKFWKNVWHWKMGKRWSFVGLLWWLSGRQSTGEYSRHQFDPWSRMNPHASEKQPLCHSYRACVLQPGSCNCWAHVLQPLKPGLPRVCAPQAERAPQWESCDWNYRAAPIPHNKRKAHPQ